ncbi:MAG TPA: hypothetical protein VGR74_12105 [Actinomycetota bacterium]|jgi:hypothetical protein|nr:hypothetical protein [Actinomycetota bacterium]
MGDHHGRAAIGLRPLREALGAGERVAWLAFRHAVEGTEPALAACVGCGVRWTDETGPQALLEAVIDGELAVGLLCLACGSQDRGATSAMLQRFLAEMLPEGARVRVTRELVVPSGPVGHA